MVLNGLFSTLITRKIKEIDTLIDSLPSDHSTTVLQNRALETMHTGNIFCHNLYNISYIL